MSSATAVAVQVLGSPQSQRDIVPVVSPRQGSLPGLVVNSPVVQPLPIATGPNNNGAPPAGAATTARPARTTTFAGYLPGSPYPFVLPPPDIPYFGSKWNGPWGEHSQSINDECTYRKPDQLNQVFFSLSK